MGKLLPALVVVAAVGLALSLGALLYVGNQRRQADRARQQQQTALDQGVPGLELPAFALVDQDNAPIDQSLFEGRVSVIDFMFTHCPFVCPGMSGEMYRLTQELAGTGVQFVSFSVDPQRDTPERLREYAATFGVDAATWRFLTGNKDTIYAIARGALQFALEEDPETKIALPDGSEMANIVHPSHLILVGPERQIIMFVPFAQKELVDQLRDRARALAAQTTPKG